VEYAHDGQPPRQSPGNQCVLVLQVGGRQGVIPVGALAERLLGVDHYETGVHDLFLWVSVEHKTIFADRPERSQADGDMYRSFSDFVDGPGLLPADAVFPQKRSLVTQRMSNRHLK
jgi:hypothetical protein